MKSRDGSSASLSSTSTSVFKLVLPERKLPPITDSNEWFCTPCRHGRIEGYWIDAGQRLENGVRKGAARESKRTLCIGIRYHNSTMPLSPAQETILFVLFRYHVGTTSLSASVFSAACLASAEYYMSYGLLLMQGIEPHTKNFHLF